MSGARVPRGVCGSVLALAIFVSLTASAQSDGGHSARERLIGAWHLIRIDAPGLDGKSAPGPQPKGMLIYTRDGHMSVQLMYPPSANTPCRTSMCKTAMRPRSGVMTVRRVFGRIGRPGSYQVIHVVTQDRYPKQQRQNLGNQGHALRV